MTLQEKLDLVVGAVEQYFQIVRNKYNMGPNHKFSVDEMNILEDIIKEVKRAD